MGKLFKGFLHFHLGNLNSFLTKGGNYSREETNKGEETIQGNMVSIMFQIEVYDQGICYL